MVAGFARTAEALHLDGDTDAALQLLAEGIRLRPRDVTGRLVLARVCLDSGRRGEAVEWLESVLRADPDCPAALVQLAELRADAETARYRKRALAREPWDESESLSTNTPNVDQTPASPELESAPAPIPHVLPVQEDEELPEDEDPANLPHIATATLAEIYFQQGLKEQAAQIYRLILERHPGDASARERLEVIETSIEGPAPRATDENG